jgi:acetyltransferase-like isoleucine patch superfamily enzyme
MLEKNVKLGKNVKIFDENLVNIYMCEIGDDSFVGPFVEITAGVKVGKRCKIESHSFICDGVELEDDVFIGHGTMFTNDLYPKVDRQVVRLRTLVKKHASMGSGVTVVGGITIGEYAVIGAGAVVTRDAPNYAILVGNPAKVMKQFSSEQELLKYMEERQSTKK